MLPFQRFDAARLRPVQASEVGERLCAGSRTIIDACRLGAGPATRPWARPWEPPQIEWPFGVFQVRSAAAARRACLALDGSWWMQDAASAGARIGIRLRALGADAAWWRPLQAGDAWDAGICDEPARLEGFRPRRATLIVIDSPLEVAGRRALAALDLGAYGLRRAVRVLLVSDGPPQPLARPLPA
jgi:hypothetical protein